MKKDISRDKEKNFIDRFVHCFENITFLKKLVEIYDNYRNIWLYLFFGFLTVVVNIASYKIFTSIFNINYLISNLVAIIISIIFAYITNKFYVFNSRLENKKDLLKEITSFFTARIISLILDMLIVYIGIGIFSFNDIIVKTISNIIVIALNYVVSKKYIFNKNDKENSVNREKIKEKVKEKIENIIFDVGFLILTFIFMCITITTIFQFIDISISIYNIIIATILTVIIYMIFRKNKNNNYDKIIAIALSLILVVLCTYSIGMVFDMTIDGNTYHKTAVGILSDGYNPVKDDTYNKTIEIMPEIASENTSLWIEHYPKATWNFAACMYKFTGNIESGKVLSFLLMIAIFCVTTSYFSKRYLKLWQSIILGVVITLNPIVVTQMFTFYVDGILGILICLVILFLIIVTDKKFNNITEYEKWYLLAVSIILCMNVKFTGIFFAGVFSLLFYFYILYQNRKNKDFKKYIINLTLKFLIIVIVGIGVFGFSTYVRNTVEHKHPLYPLFGDGKVDIITNLQPKEFGSQNRVEKLYKSIFSKTENITYQSNKSPTLKIPFTIDKNEINELYIPDSRIGGFGVLFSGILLISITIISISLIYLYVKNKKSIFNIVLIIILGIVISTLSIEESWWARYANQIYIFPMIALFLIFYIANNMKIYYKKIVLNSIAIVFTIIIIFNIKYFINHRVKDLDISRSLRNEFYTIKNLYNDKILKLKIEDNFRVAMIYNFRDFGIKYNITKDEKEVDTYLINTWFKYKMER